MTSITVDSVNRTVTVTVMGERKTFPLFDKAKLARVEANLTELIGLMYAHALQYEQRRAQEGGRG